MRSEFYYENWRIRGGEHHPFTGSSLHGFDPARVQSENMTTVAFYCWTAPWQSEPAAIWFAQQHPDVTVYDLKGLSYLDDIPGFCQFIDGNQQFINQMTDMDNGPRCAAEETGTHECAEGTPEARAQAMDPVIPADFTEGIGADQANEQVSAELREAEAEFNAAHGVSRPPKVQVQSHSEPAAAIDNADRRLVIVGAVAFCLSGLMAGFAYTRYARAVGEAQAPSTSLETKDDSIEIEVVDSPLEAVAVPAEKSQTSEV